jgi:hypothetical protein
MKIKALFLLLLLTSLSANAAMTLVSWTNTSAVVSGIPSGFYVGRAGGQDMLFLDTGTVLGYCVAGSGQPGYSTYLTVISDAYAANRSIRLVCLPTGDGIMQVKYN